MSSAAAAPWASRKPISIPGLTANAQASEAAAKPAAPSANSRFRPYRSPRRAPAIIPAANASAYPPMIHCSAAALACRLARTVGAATFTIVPSSRSMHSAASTSARMAHRRGCPARTAAWVSFRAMFSILLRTNVPNIVRYYVMNDVLHCWHEHVKSARHKSGTVHPAVGGR